MQEQNTHLLDWLTPVNKKEENVVVPRTQENKLLSPQLQDWLTPIKGVEDNLVAEKPDIKTRIRMQMREAPSSQIYKSSPWDISRKTSPSRIGEKDFWSNLIKNMGTQSREFVKSIPQLAESVSRITPSGFTPSLKDIAPLPREKSVLEPRGYKAEKTKEKISLKELPFLESLKNIGELVTYLPIAGAQMMKDPVKFIEERPLDMLFLIDAIGIKPAMGLRNKIKSGKSITGKDMMAVIDQVPNTVISPEVKKIIRETLPKDKEIAVKTTVQTFDKELKPQKPTTFKTPLKQAEVEVGKPIGETIKQPLGGIGEEFKIETIKPGEEALYNVYIGEKNTGGKPDYKQISQYSAVRKGIVTVDGVVDYLESKGLKVKNKPTELVTESPESPIKEFHSGYPLSKEVKDSYKHLANRFPGGVMVDTTSGSIGGDVGKIIKPPKPEKPPRIIKGKETELMLEPYTVPPINEPLVIVKQKNRGTMPVFQHEIAPFQQSRVKDIPFSSIKQDFTTSQRIFDRYPPLKKVLYEPWRIADKKIFDSNLHIKKTVVPEWKKAVGMEGINPKKSSERIATYLTGLSEHGVKLLEADGRKVIALGELTPSEARVVTESRKMFDDFFVEVNKARELSGQKPIKYEQNYFPFMRNLDYLKKEGLNIIVDDVRTIERHLSGNSFKHAIKRKMKDGIEYSIPIDMDFFSVFEDYATSANQAINITPVVAKARALTEDFKIATGEYKKNGQPKKPITWNIAQNTPKLRNFITRWADSLVQRTYIPSSDTANLVAKSVTSLNRNVGGAVLSMNFRSAAIQPSAFRNSVIDLGEFRLAQGMIENLSPVKRKFAIENSFVLAPRKGAWDVHVREIKEHKGKSAVGKAKQLATDYGLSLLQLLDMETARATWLGAYEKGKSSGLKGVDLIHFADDSVTRTQASGKIGEISQIQKTPMGKFITLFQTFTINEWGYIAQDVFGIKNPKVSTPKAMLNTFRLIYSTLAVNALFEGVLRIRSPFPAPEWAMIHGLEEGRNGKEIAVDMLRELGEQVPVVGGTIRYSTRYRTPLPLGGQLGMDTATFLNKILSGRIEDVSPYDAENLGKILGIPGTAQVFKYLRRRKDGMSHAQAIIGVRSTEGSSDGGRGRSGR